MAGSRLPPQELVRTESGYAASYEIFIATWAGTTLLDVQDGDDHRQIVLDVRPHAHKLGDAAFDAMLTELSEHSAGLIWGLSPGATHGRVAPGSLAVVHPAVIASQLPAFERLLTRFLSDPPVLTVRVRGLRPLDLTRRLDLVTLRRLGRRPTLLAAIRGDGTAGSMTDPRTPVDQPLPMISYDHPMTRYVAHLLRRLVVRFRASADTLQKAPGRPFHDAVIESHAAVLADMMNSAAARLETKAGTPLLRHVTPEPLGPGALQALPDQPLFGALHRIGQRLLTPGLAYGPGGDLRAALKHSYDLFELLVLYRLIDALPAILGTGWRLRLGKALRAAGREERPPDRAVWWFDGPDGAALELRYQQWFSRARPVPDRRLFTSLSGVNIPDYILVMRRAGKPTGWLILDAKYRSGRQSVEQGLGDVHRYRDALRIRGLKATGAFIVVPSLRDAEAAYAQPMYHAHHGFGVLRLFEADWLAPVQQTLFVAMRDPDDAGAPTSPAGAQTEASS